MKRAAILGCLAAVTVATPAAAKEIGFVITSAVKDKPAVTLDKAQAYILLRTDAALPLHLMKLPSALDRSTYDRMRADALAEAREKYPRRLASYEKAKALDDSIRRQGGRGSRVPEKPVEPTEENFEFTPFGLLSGVSIGPMNRFSKQDGGASVYLQAVTPGSYRIYGPVSALANGGAVGTCLCMGSVAFEARAGEITDMGMIAVKAPAEAEDGPQADGIAPFNFQIQPATADMTVDPRLKDMAVRPAAYRPVGKLPNYFGLTIDRLAEMPGVFRYDRDRIVDLTAPAAGQ